jgi:hypothetical protein
MGLTKDLGSIPRAITVSGSNNNVGVSKEIPNAKLDVNGNTIITGSLNVTQGITGSLFGTASFVNLSGLGGFVQGGNSFGAQALIGTNDNQSLALETSGSIRMTIAADGATTFSGSVASNGTFIANYTGGNILLKGPTDGFLGTSTGNRLLLTDWDTATKGLQINLSNGAATFSSTLTGQSYGVTNESIFRGGLYSYKGISGGGTDFGITIFAESGTGNGNIYFCPGGSATRAATINSSGRLILGTTDDAGFRINVEASGRVGLFKQTAVSLSNGFYALDIDNLAHSSNMTTAGAFRISTNGNSGAFVVNGGGNVGIGITNPGVKLDVDGDVSATGIVRLSKGASDTIQQGSTIYLVGGTGSSYTQLQQGVGRFTIWGFNGSSWGEKLTIRHSDGNVGIGTTNPYTLLDVNGSIGINNVTAPTDGASDSRRAGIGWKASGANNVLSTLITTNNDGTWGGHLSFYTRPAGSGAIPERMRITSEGNLEILGTATGLAGAYILNTSTNLKIHSTLGGGTTKDLILQSGGSDGAPQIILKAGGNVGIGDGSSTTSKLSVNGSARVRRTVYSWFQDGWQGNGTFRHYKTNMWAGSGGNTMYTMSLFKAYLYSYSTSTVLEGSCGFHNWSGVIYNLGITGNVFSNVYASSDGFVVLVTPSGTGETGITIDWHQAYGYPYVEAIVTASKLHGSTTGGY